MEVMNIANLGNVFKDAHLPHKAEEAYREAISKAREYDLGREEGRALELLARLEYERGEWAHSLVLGRRALKLHKGTQNSLRIACTLDYLARAYAKTGKREKAAARMKLLPRAIAK